MAASNSPTSNTEDLDEEAGGENTVNDAGL